MKNLSNTDYVIWDKANDTLVRFHSNSDIVIYGNIEDAQEDSYANEWVTKCTDLPEHLKEELIYQINKM